MRQQFRFASEGQSRSSRLRAERSPGMQARLCRFASNAVVMSLAAGSDEHQACLAVAALSRSSSAPGLQRPASFSCGADLGLFGGRLSRLR